MPQLTSILTTLAIGPLAVLGSPVHNSAGAHWGSKNFKTLVAFGDSYTDESRLNYFIAHDGDAPPVGWDEPDVRNPSLRDNCVLTITE